MPYGADEPKMGKHVESHPVSTTICGIQNLF